MIWMTVDTPASPSLFIIPWLNITSKLVPSCSTMYSACAVTLSYFGHYNRSCLLTYLLTSNNQINSIAAEVMTSDSIRNISSNHITITTCKLSSREALVQEDL